MNKLGVHALVWAAGWSHDECARAIGQTAELGYDIIEIPALDPGSIDVAFTRAQLEKNGIGATSSLGLDAETDISSGDPEKTRRGQARLEQAVAMGRDIGATHICGILHSAFQKYAIPTTAEGVKRSVEVLQRVAESAARSDITLGLEVVNRYESNVLNTASQAVEMCKRIGAPNVKVHLDVYHMNIEESDITAAIMETGDYLGYFHTGDSHRGYMGSGTIDLAGVFRALVKSNYQGPITFESFSSRVVGQPLEGILGIWRNLWEDGRELAAHARQYTLAQLKAAHEAQKQTSRSRLV
jgi:D-psicose/D-tagatose/L-ribulose 3-epimerase